MLGKKLNDVIRVEKYCKMYDEGYYIVEAPKDSNEDPWTWGWWKNPMVETYFEAQEDILKMLEDPDFIDNQGYVDDVKMMDVLKARYDFDEVQVWAIIDQLDDENLIITPAFLEGEIKLKIEAIYGPQEGSKCFYGYANPVKK